MNKVVRCEDFYKHWEKKGNFCGKSEMVVKKVEEYIDYVKRNKMSDFGGYKISNCAIDPFISIEFLKHGKVHQIALRELKSMIRRRKVLPDKITRRFSVELINKANAGVEAGYKLENIPGVRSRMGEFEHEISEVSYDIRDMFNIFKNDIGIKNNNQAMKVMLECCIKHVDDMKQIKEGIDNKEKFDDKVKIVTTA